MHLNSVLFSLHQRKIYAFRYEVPMLPIVLSRGCMLVASLRARVYIKGVEVADGAEHKRAQPPPHRGRRG